MQDILKQISDHPENANISRIVEFWGFENHHKLRRVTLIVDVFHFFGTKILLPEGEVLSSLDLVQNNKPNSVKNYRIRLTADMTTKVYADTGAYVNENDIIEGRPQMMEYEFYWFLFENNMVSPNYIDLAIQRADAYQVFNLPYSDFRVEVH
jgi:hypothetical protein